MGRAKRVALYVRVSTDGQTTVNQQRELGKFLVTFGDVQATDDLLAKLGCEWKTNSRIAHPDWFAPRLCAERASLVG